MEQAYQALNTSGARLLREKYPECWAQYFLHDDQARDFVKFASLQEDENLLSRGFRNINVYSAFVAKGMRPIALFEGKFLKGVVLVYHRNLLENQSILQWMEENLSDNADSQEFLWADIRRERDKLLQRTDWTQLPDTSLKDSEKEAWKVYREALRALPQRITNSRKIVWPRMPNQGGEKNEPA